MKGKLRGIVVVAGLLLGLVATADKSQQPASSCPPRLAARLAKQWKLIAGAKVDQMRCQAGHFPRPGYFVRAWVATDPKNESMATLHTLVVSADLATMIAEADDNTPAPWLAAERHLPPVDLVDFDGDGADEIVVYDTISHGGDSDSTIEVLRLAAPKLVSVFAASTASDNSGRVEDDSRAYQCSTKVSFPAKGKGHELVLVGTIARGANASAERTKDCKDGRVVYRLMGDQFVNTSAKDP